MDVALMVSVMAVAMPQPMASSPSTATNRMSRQALMRQPLAMMSAGVRVSPTERSSAEPMLSTSEHTMAAA